MRHRRLPGAAALLLTCKLAAAAPALSPEPAWRSGPQAERLAAQLQALLGDARGHLYLPATAPQPLRAQLQAVLLQTPAQPVLLDGGYQVLSAARGNDARDIALLVTGGEGGDLVAAGALRPGCWIHPQPPRTPCAAAGTLTLFMAPGVGPLPALEIQLRDWARAQLQPLHPQARRPPMPVLLQVVPLSRP